MDELAVVPDEVEETVHGPGRTWSQPIMDHLHLGRDHGNARRRYDMAEVGDGGSTKRALGALDEELVVPKLGEDNAEVAQVVGSCLVVN